MVHGCVRGSACRAREALELKVACLPLHGSPVFLTDCTTHSRAESGGEEMLVSCPHVGTFGLPRIVMGGRGGGGGHSSMGADEAQNLWVGQYERATANKGGHGGKVTGMPRRGREGILV